MFECVAEIYRTGHRLAAAVGGATELDLDNLDRVVAGTVKGSRLYRGQV
jgi:hypothetical protein